MFNSDNNGDDAHSLTAPGLGLVTLPQRPQEEGRRRTHTAGHESPGTQQGSDTSVPPQLASPRPCEGALFVTAQK